MKKFFLFLVCVLMLSQTVNAVENPFDVVWEQPLIKGAEDLRVLDFDRNGVPEIYVLSYSTKNTILSCFHSNGTLLWDAAIPKFSYNAYPTEETKLVRVGDVDGDEYLDIIIGGEVIAPAVNYHPLYLGEREPEKGVGVVMIQWRWTYDKSDLTTSAYVVGFYGSNVKYVVTSSSDFNVYVFSIDGKVADKFDAGSSVWDVNVVNVDEDDELEFVAGTFKGIVFFNNKTIVWSHPTESRVIKVSSYDLNSDGLLEFLGASRFKVYVLDPSGRLFWERKIDDLTSNIIVAGLEGDGKPYIVFGSGSKLMVFDREGNTHWEASFGGRINSVGTVDVDGDGILEIILGLNNRLILLKLGSVYVKQDLAVSHYKKATDAYSTGDISKAVFELEESIGIYSELNKTEDVGELTTLLIEYKKTLLVEDQIKQAFDYLNKSRELYLAGRLDNASYYSHEAKKIFETLNNSYGVREADELIAKVEGRKKADALLEEAEKLYVSGRFEEALNNSRQAHSLYIKLNNSLGVKKSSSVISLSEEALKTTTTLKIIPPATTVRLTTTLRHEKPEENKYLLYTGTILLVLMLYYTVKSTLAFRRKKRSGK